MSPRTPLLLNLVILLVNFVLLVAHAASEDRVFRAARQSAAAPAPWRRLVHRPVATPGFDGSDTNRATGGAIGPIPHTRLLKFLSVADDADELSPAQREAVVDALEACCRSLRSASAAWLRETENPRTARERIVRDVAARLRAAELPDDALARLVRVVVASAG